MLGWHTGTAHVCMGTLFNGVAFPVNEMLSFLIFSADVALPNVWTGSSSGIVCVWAWLKSYMDDGFYMKSCSGNRPAVVLLLLLAWSPTFFSNPRDI